MTPARQPVDLAAERLASVRGLARALDLEGAEGLTPGQIRRRLTELGSSLSGSRKEAARALYAACKEAPEGGLTADTWGHVSRGFDALERV